MSHHAVATKPADDPAFQLPSGMAKLWMPLTVAGIVILIAGFFLAWAVDLRFAMSSYLTAWIYGVTISIGCLFFVLVQHLCRAGWSVVVRRVAELIMVMIIPLAILFIPILATIGGDGALYAWTDSTYIAEHMPADVWEEKNNWLNPAWFSVRSLIYLTIWSSLAVFYFRRSRLQDETGERKLTESLQAFSGPAIILFSFCTTFAAFDWLMSLAPMWFSTMFGVYIFTGGILSAHCMIALATFVFQKQGAMRDEVTVEHYHDLGKLIFGFVCFWGYIAFSQYMLIWYGNIPEETHWFYVRSQGGWESLSVLLMVAHWGIPLFAIMSRHVRRRPMLVAIIAAYILVMHYIDLYWIVMPEAEAGFGGAVGVAGSLLCVLGVVGLMLGLVFRVAQQTKLVPVRDPRLEESLAFHNI